MSYDELAIFQNPDDGFGYKRCWICNTEKTPLKWIWYRGRLVHSCNDCLKELEQ